MAALENARHEAFCLAYLGAAGFNGAEAARLAGYSPKNARDTAHQLMQREDVRARLKELTDGVMDRLEISVDRIAEEYARIAFADPRWIVQWTDGKVELRPSEELSEVAASAIAEVKQVPATAHSGGGVAVKFHDKLRALDGLAKWKKMFSDAPEIVNNTFVVEVPAPLTPEQWQERYGKK